jgi:hypothetical protein
MIKLRKMGWDVARMGEIRNVCKIFIEELKGKLHTEDMGIDRRIILKWILGEWKDVD